MKQLTVNSNDAGQRIDKFLMKYFRSLPGGMIYKWLRKKRIRLNGVHPKNDTFLRVGDVLELYINDEFFPKEREIPEYIKTAAMPNIIYEDKNIIIVNKPSGICAHDGADSLVNRILSYLYHKGEYDPAAEHTFAPALCHRIDRNTSGLVIAAKNATALRFFNEKIRLRQIRKIYYLYVEGELEADSGVIEGYITKDNTQNKVIFSKTETPGSKHAVTSFKKVKDRVEAELITGRTHQIRASFAYIGHPICGDVKYGAKKDGGKSYQRLCAGKLIFDFCDRGEFEYLNGKTFEVR